MPSREMLSWRASPNDMFDPWDGACNPIQNPHNFPLVWIRFQFICPNLPQDICLGFPSTSLDRKESYSCMPFTYIDISRWLHPVVPCRCSEAEGGEMEPWGTSLEQTSLSTTFWMLLSMCDWRHCNTSHIPEIQLEGCHGSGEPTGLLAVALSIPQCKSSAKVTRVVYFPDPSWKPFKWI